MDAGHSADWIDTDIPARLDRLRWCPFHTLVVAALGITWVLDGLEVTLAGAVAGALKASPSLHLSDSDVGLAASAYLAGAVGGALLFGWLADRIGRRPLFFVTLGVYLVATAMSALAQDFLWFAVFRLLTGAGIGGEYTAINSAIQELVPARYRGHCDLVIGGSFWLGAALGASGALLLLDPRLFPPDVGWRLAFGIGAGLGLLILPLRRFVPESPRWLLMHGARESAERVMRQIEAGVPAKDGPAPATRMRIREQQGLVSLAQVLVRRYPRRAVVGLLLMASQAFFYNAIFFTYALVLGRFFGVPPQDVGAYLLPFAAGNFLGPLVLGRWFDSIGRRQMIALTYVVSGLLLLIVAALFAAGLLNALTQTLAWTVVFFFASAAAGSAYLTVGESFPLEVRALAIALFYALGTAAGGIAGPALLGTLIGTGARGAIAGGYALGALLMVAAGAVAWRYGLAAERRSLEDLSAADPVG